MSWALVIGFLIGYIGEQVLEAFDMPPPPELPLITDHRAPESAEINAGRDL